jgi:Domain of unknown function (DUF4136)
MKIRWFALAVLLCLVPVVALAQQVNTDWKHGTDFSKYTTYAWGNSPRPVQDPLWNQRIVSDIDTALQGKGLQKVAADANPSLMVVYNAGVKQNVSYEGYRMGWGMGEINPVTENEGTLVVDLADPQSKMIIWRGMSAETLSDKSQKNIEKVQKMVNKMFEKYPPKQ